MISQPKYHPNLRPVLCDNLDDIRKLAEEMRAGASLATDVDFGNDKEIADRMLNAGILRFIVYNGQLPVNVCFTLSENNEWNLSISHATPSGPVLVDDELSLAIVESFLGEGFQEVPSKIVGKIRHFKKEA